MDVNLLQLLRVVHIVCAALWLGMAATLGFFVAPTFLNGDIVSTRVLERVMVKGKLGVWLPVIVILALISGLWLYHIDFPDMQMASFTKRALDYALGGFLGILAFIVGISVNFPTGGKLASLGDSIGANTPTVEQSAELARLSRKLLISSRSTAILTLGAAALMALARFAR